MMRKAGEIKRIETAMGFLPLQVSESEEPLRSLTGGFLFLLSG